MHPTCNRILVKRIWSSQPLLRWIVDLDLMVLNGNNFYGQRQLPRDFPTKLSQPNQSKPFHFLALLAPRKLYIPYPAIVVISVLTFRRIAGLLALGTYASLQPTSTASLDGIALLRIRKEIGDEFPLISAVEAKHTVILDRTEGWIGDERRKEGDGDVERFLQVGRSECAVKTANNRIRWE